MYCPNTKRQTLLLTYWCPDSVALRVEQTSNLHKIAVPLDVVVDHGRLHEEGVITLGGGEGWRSGGGSGGGGGGVCVH